MSGNSYQYLKSFDGWLKEQITVNQQMARVYYPLFFLITVFGFWFSNLKNKTLGKEIIDQLMIAHPDLLLVFGIPFYVLVLALIVSSLLAFFGDKIYNWDVNVIYGRVFKKLDEMIADMEELRK